MKMKSMFRQLVTLSLSLVMCVLMIPGASAASYQIGDVTIETGMSDPHQIQPRMVIYSQNVSDATIYNADFSCNENNGTTMKFTIKNTGNASIYVDVYMNGELIPGSYVVPAGESRFTRVNDKNGGLDDDFRFHLYTLNDEPMSCTMYAEQY